MPQTDAPGRRGGAKLALVGVTLLLAAGTVVAWRLNAFPGLPFTRREDASAPPAAAQAGLSAEGAVSPEAVSEAACLATRRSQRAVEGLAQAFLPQHDGWDSEHFHDACAAQFKPFEQALAAGRAPTEEEVAALALEDVRCTPLAPRERTIAFQDALFTVERGRLVESGAALTGRAALGAEFAKLAARWHGVRDAHVKFKFWEIELDAQGAWLTAYYQAGGRGAEGPRQQYAVWRCRWRRVGDAPQLVELRLLDFEETSSRGGPLFADCTQAALGANPSFAVQVRPGTAHWLSRIEAAHTMHNYVRQGVAVGDVNGDGREDVYLTQPGGLPNKLFVQQPDGTARDESASAGVDWLDDTASALFVDLDNDGDQDLAAAVLNFILVAENDGRGRFEVRAALATPDAKAHGLSAADYDLDGDLDLFLPCGFVLGEQQREQARFVYHDAKNGAPNFLFRNDLRDGAWRFTNATEETGLGRDNFRHSLAAAWQDYDQDGDPDLYVANDYGPNQLFKNDGGRFVDVAVAAGVTDQASGMSAAWGDYDGDGRPDLYVGNMFSAAGMRIVRQQRFKASVPEAVRAMYPRFAKGNSLFRNQGDGTFREVSGEARVEMGRWAWSSPFADLNNDGRLDLLVANGYLTKPDTRDL